MQQSRNSISPRRAILLTAFGWSIDFTHNGIRIPFRDKTSKNSKKKTLRTHRNGK